jgi:hypothetical protein
MNNETTVSSYEQQAIDFAKKYGVKLSIGEPTYKDFWHDGQMRWVFPCKLSREGKSYSFKFGQSIAAGKQKPTMYNILACMTKNDPEDYDFFCSNYGYEKSRSAYSIYLAVCREYEGMRRLFNPEELEEMQDIA